MNSIEFYPDQYWMNCVQDALHKFSEDLGIRFQCGVNQNWPSMQGKPSGVKTYGLNIVWRGQTVEGAHWLKDLDTAVWLRELLLKGRQYACPHLTRSYITIDEKQGRLLPRYAKKPYYNSFDPMI